MSRANDAQASKELQIQSVLTEQFFLIGSPLDKKGPEILNLFSTLELPVITHWEVVENLDAFGSKCKYIKAKFDEND